MPHNVENCSRSISKELTIINRSHHVWFKNSDKRKSTEIRVYEADGFLERERLCTL